MHGANTNRSLVGRVFGQLCLVVFPYLPFLFASILEELALWQHYCLVYFELGVTVFALDKEIGVFVISERSVDN